MVCKFYLTKVMSIVFSDSEVVAIVFMLTKSNMDLTFKKNYIQLSFANHPNRGGLVDEMKEITLANDVIKREAEKLKVEELSKINVGVLVTMLGFKQIDRKWSWGG